MNIPIEPKRTVNPINYAPLQLPLELPVDLLTARSGTIFNDPAFASNKSLPIHRWVPWIAGFSREFVQGALTNYLPKPGGIVLDPFSGVGTTLVESLVQGHEPIAFEINPYAYLASKTKADAIHINANKLRSAIEAFENAYKDRITTGQSPTSMPPPGFKTRLPFYSPAVLAKVLTIQDLITAIEDSTIQAAFKLAFAATMVRYSNYSYEPSLATRLSSGKENILDFAVGETVLTKLKEMLEDIEWLQSVRTAPYDVAPRVINDSFFNYEQYLEPDSIDLIITSPPYLNNYHYNRNTRPHLYWLGYAERPSDLKPLEEANFGKYWQTVRDRVDVPLEFSLTNPDLQNRLNAVAHANPDKGVYGGQGWANYATSYMNDSHRFALAIQNVLKPGATALIVIGNSILQGIMIPTDEYLGQIAVSVGLELVDIHIPRATRVGSSITQSDVRVGATATKHQLYEAVVELRKS